MFNYENDIPSDKEEATTSKNVNKMLSKSPAKKKIFKRDHLIADNILKSITKQTSDQDSEVQIDSDLDFDKSTNAGDIHLFTIHINLVEAVKLFVLFQIFRNIEQK